MGVRLVLVSVVAGLGLTLPTGKQLTSWRESAQTWVSARLAAWDARMPADEEAFVYVAETAPDADTESVEAEEPAPVPAAAPAEAATPELAATGSPNAPQADYADGLDVPTEPTAFDETEMGTAGGPVADLTALDAAFNAAQNEVVAGFATERPAAPRFEPIEVGEDLDRGMAFTLNREAEGLTADAARFEPVEVGDDLYPGVAYALNRQAEGLDLSTRPEPSTVTDRVVMSGASPRDGRLGHAVRLTRDAVYAWANLLHGPAVVTIAH